MTTDKIRRLLYTNENNEIFLMTNYCKVYFFNENTLQVLQFKRKEGVDLVKEYNGFWDGSSIGHYKISIEDLPRVLALGVSAKSRRSIKTIQKICREKFGVKARAYNGKIWTY